MDDAYETFVDMCKADIDGVNNLNYVIFSIDSVIKLMDEGEDVGLLGGRTLMCLLKLHGTGKITKPVPKTVLVHFRRYVNHIRLAKIGNVCNYYKPTKDNIKKAEKCAHKLFEVLMDSNIDECLLLMLGHLTKEDFKGFKKRHAGIIYLSFATPFISSYLDKDIELELDTTFKHIDNTFRISREVTIREVGGRLTKSTVVGIISETDFTTEMIK